MTAKAALVWRERPMGDVSVAASVQQPKEPAHRNMIFIPGGTFRMGLDRHYPEEAPVHRITVSGFWIERTPVTSRQFKEFVRITDYVTFAKLPPDPKNYPGAPPRMLYPRSAARHAEPVDTSTSHVGFRCVIRRREP